MDEDSVSSLNILGTKEEVESFTPSKIYEIYQYIVNNAVVDIFVIGNTNMDDIVKYLRKFVPGYEKCYLTASGEMTGIRETRHFKGVITLTPEDIVEAKVFDDWIAVKNYFNFDIKLFSISLYLFKNSSKTSISDKGSPPVKLMVSQFISFTFTYIF